MGKIIQIFVAFSEKLNFKRAVFLNLDSFLHTGMLEKQTFKKASGWGMGANLIFYYP